MSEFTDKQQAFIDHYLSTLVGVEAARLAKYKGNYNTLCVVAHENLRKPKIRNEINKRMKELTIAPDEVIYRLQDHALGSIEVFVRFNGDGAFWVDLDKAREAGVLHLAKEIKQDKKVYTDKDGNTEVTYRTEVKIHDSQAALDKLAKCYGLYVDRRELTGKGGEPIRLKFIDYGLDDPD